MKHKDEYITTPAINLVRWLFTLSFISLVILLSSCEDLIETGPPRTELISETVFSGDATAIAAINGIYSEMVRVNGGLASGDNSSVTYLAGLSADELDFYKNDPGISAFNRNSLTPANNVNTNDLWGQAYKIIFHANSVLRGLTNSTEISEDVARQLEGEAKFLRAFCHFYLVNLYGEVPIVTTTVYQENNVATKSSTDEVYHQIISDLKEAQSLLGEDYPTGERVRPNQAAATAMLARTYLFAEDWVDAESAATKLIDNARYRLLSDLNAVFLANSGESIWQLRPVELFLNTNEALRFILAAPPLSSTGGVALTSQVQAAFEAGDQRGAHWVASFTDGTDTWHYSYKYKVRQGEEVTEYSMVLRLAEQYLIRAEARVQQGNIAGARADLNIIRHRAGLPSTTAGDPASLLMAVAQERRVELFTEWGHRWFDLKRTGRADAVLGGVKADWQPADVLYPIPQSELEANANLLPQNPGY